MAIRPFRYPIHILTFYDRSEKAWTSYCLDFNLAEDGNSREKSEKRLFEVISSYLAEAKNKHMTAEEIYSAAPKFFWDLIVKSRPIKVRREPKKVSFPYLTFQSPPQNVACASL